MHEAPAFGCKEGNISLVTRLQKRHAGRTQANSNDTLNVKRFGQRCWTKRSFSSAPSHWPAHQPAHTLRSTVADSLLLNNNTQGATWALAKKLENTTVQHIRLLLNNFTRIQAKGSATTRRVWRLISDALKHYNQRCIEYKS